MQDEFPVINIDRTAQRLKLLMQCKGLKPTDIQKYLNLACVQTIYHWIEGINIPSIDHLYALSQLFGVRIDDIIVGNKHEYIDGNLYQQQMRVLTYHHLLREAA